MIESTDVTYELTLTEPMLGSKPSNAGVFTDYIATRKIDGLDGEELKAAEEAEDRVKESMTVFHRMEDGKTPMIGNYQILCSKSLSEKSPSDVRPGKRTVADCLENTWGKWLARLFNQYLLQASCSHASWWELNALQYCVISEWWSMFTGEDPEIDEIWDNDLNPDDVFDRVQNWAAKSPGAPAILLQDSPDLRWREFHNAFTWGKQDEPKTVRS